jgi:hypothetical protein
MPLSSVNITTGHLSFSRTSSFIPLFPKKNL